jgi:hemerythrin superfamily protein
VCGTPLAGDTDAHAAHEEAITMTTTTSSQSSPQSSTSPGQTSGDEDVVTLLTRQHRRLETLLKALTDSESGAERATLLGRAGDELAVHLGAEETVFYPAVRASATEDILLESLEEHLSLKRLLADLLALPTNDTTFPPKCQVLAEQARHHHKEEEEHLFPKVHKLLDDAQRLQLGQQVRQHEQTLQSRGAPREEVKSQTDAAEPLT